MFSKYYQDELQFLHELGQEFSHAHPDAAHYLTDASRDPDVERLLEGFAFLSARVRQKLDDEFPELSQGLFQMLWPHYLRPIPAMSMLKLTPVYSAMRGSQRVARGCEVHSVPVEGTTCRFVTSFDVTLNPMSVDRVALEKRTSGASRLRIRFKLWNRARPEDLDLRRVRLYLDGDTAVSGPLYVALCRHVADAGIVPSSAKDSRIIAGSHLKIEPAGFDDEEALLPYPLASPPAFRLLQEYFALPSKFRFVDIVGLDALAGTTVEDGFDVDIRFDKELDAGLRPSADNVRLYCTPIVNLFETDGDPIRLDRTQTEYRIRPTGKSPLHYEVFDVRSCSTYRPGTGEERPLPSFYEFRDPQGDSGASFYSLTRRPSVVDDRVDTYVSFVDVSGSTALPETEYVSFELTCTNRRLPEALRIGDVSVPTDSSPPFVQFTNIAPVTASVPPPLTGELPWRLVSHMSFNRMSLVSAQVLRGMFQLYNFQAVRDAKAARANALRMEAIQNVRTEPADVLARGGMMRGSHVTVEVLEDRFGGEGDLYLFGAILNEFIGLHATLNSFIAFTLQGMQQGESYHWPPRIGRDLL